MNQQQAALLEDSKNRKIAIQNQQRQQKEADVIWRWVGNTKIKLISFF